MSKAVTTAEERRLIDEAVAAGRVQVIPMGLTVSFNEYEYTGDRGNRMLRVKGEDKNKLAMEAKRTANLKRWAAKVKVEQAVHDVYAAKRQQIWDLVQGGKLTRRQIATQLGVSITTVYREIKERRLAESVQVSSP